MSEYTEYFSTKSDDDVLKKNFYTLVNDYNIPEVNAWYILSMVIGGKSIEDVVKAVGKDIKDVLNKFKYDYDAKIKLDELTQKKEAEAFRNSLKPETINRVKEIWKELNN